MGNKLFGIDIAGLVHKNVSPGVNSCTLIKVTKGTRTPGQVTGGTQPTTKNHAAKGFIDQLRRSHLENSIVQQGDQLIAIVGDSISGGAVPKPGDKVLIRDNTYNIVVVNVDPADALYECVGRSE